MKKEKVKVTQLCPTLCNTMVYTVHGILQVRILEWAAYPFSGGSSLIDLGSPALQVDSLLTELSEKLFPPPGDFPNPGIKPRSPALEADSLPAEPQGKPFLFENLMKHDLCQLGSGPITDKKEHKLNNM